MSGKNIFFLTGLVCGLAVGSVGVGMAMADTQSTQAAQPLSRLETLEAQVQRLESSQSTRKRLVLEGQDSVKIFSGKASLEMKKDGSITLQGKEINVKASSDVILKGSKIRQN